MVLAEVIAAVIGQASGIAESDSARGRLFGPGAPATRASLMLASAERPVASGGAGATISSTSILLLDCGSPGASAAASFALRSLFSAVSAYYTGG